GPVNVENAYGSYTSIQSLLIPVPLVTGLSTSSGSTGAAITVFGQHFTGATTVYAQRGQTRVSCPFSVVDDYQLTMTFCAPATGTGDVVGVKNYGASPLVQTDQFTPTGPAPTITSVSPASGPATGGTTILIKGSGLTEATAVSVGSPVASFTVVDDATISAVT